MFHMVRKTHPTYDFCDFLPKLADFKLENRHSRNSA